jgi:endonuclease/exonuclease/phosphatase family metal-dependent hydrolase
MSLAAMKVKARRLRCVAFFFILLAGIAPGDAQPAAATAVAPVHFRVATYNLENYLDQPIGNRHPKTAEAKAQIRENLRLLNADVLALQEMGSTNALFELRASLQAEGFMYPFWEHVSGSDTNIHVAILSRFPITRRSSHTNESFLLFGRRFRVSRGLAEVDIRVNDQYEFTLITAHLKSRRPVPEADEAELREQEALILRDKITALLQTRPNRNLIVLGDFNDTQDSKSTRAVIGRGRHALIDTRPAERENGETRTASQAQSISMSSARRVTWTHYYAKEDSFSRIDYILLSAGMAREWDKADTYVQAVANWGVGSDHRPIVAGFFAEDR